MCLLDALNVCFFVWSWSRQCAYGGHTHFHCVLVVYDFLCFFWQVLVTRLFIWESLIDSFKEKGKQSSQMRSCLNLGFLLHQPPHTLQNIQRIWCQLNNHFILYIILASFSCAFCFSMSCTVYIIFCICRRPSRIPFFWWFLSLFSWPCCLFLAPFSNEKPEEDRQTCVTFNPIKSLSLPVVCLSVEISSWK